MQVSRHFGERGSLKRMIWFMVFMWFIMNAYPISVLFARYYG